MKNSSVFVVRVMQFWMAMSLLFALTISSVLAAPFLLVGFIVDFFPGEKRPYSGKLPRLHSQAKLDYQNF
jgi:hypothetical protein